MKRTGAVLTALALAGAGLAALPRFEMRSFVNPTGAVGGVRPAFAWCDAPNRVLAVTQPARDPGNSAQPVTLHRWLKRPTAGMLATPARLGPSEGAAGSVLTRLSFPNVTGTDANFFVRTSNVENVLDPAYRLTRVNEFRTPEGSFRCRYQPQAVFMGATAKRTVIVWDNGRTATYATRNFDGTPGLYVTGGKVSYDELGPEYIFEAAGGYSYRVKYDEHSAFVQVRRSGKAPQTEHFLAYSASMPTPLPPVPRVPIKYPSTP